MTDDPIEAAAAPNLRSGILDIVPDPEGAGWLVLRLAAFAIDGGSPIWTVESTHDEEGDAEAAAGCHATPIVDWLLRDPALGWLRGSKCSWIDDPSRAARWTEADARRLAAAEPGLELRVLRASGLVTHPSRLPGPDLFTSPAHAGEERRP